MLGLTLEETEEETEVDGELETELDTLVDGDTELLTEDETELLTELETLEETEVEGETLELGEDDTEELTDVDGLTEELGELETDEETEVDGDELAEVDVMSPASKVSQVVCSCQVFSPARRCPVMFVSVTLVPIWLPFLNACTVLAFTLISTTSPAELDAPVSCMTVRAPASNLAIR